MIVKTMAAEALAFLCQGLRLPEMEELILEVAASNLHLHVSAKLAENFTLFTASRATSSPRRKKRCIRALVTEMGVELVQPAPPALRPRRAVLCPDVIC